MNVLIVEDENIIALELERIAQEAGHQTIGPVSTMEQALAHAQRSDVALVDLSLSDGMTGAQLARRLIDRHRVDVIFVTGRPENVGHGIEGALDVISKPFTDERIVGALSRAEAARRKDFDSSKVVLS
ncbi:DNA-binding LytR/AlgR family response regulator [Rhizobium leguminosarum]|uniref:DNA-binding LytR/AlgR family response regulator n=1 Tax=Rhizobium leguminosarum TaxID=384 RepID=A0AAE2SWV7_RHILE|nr:MULTISPECIES: response regulator [Rhizobium]MBB4289859.1 DNA-binding LytR/AlgR family response regulator [Rhizobium leguminosarum]MBB4296502.1 DNA-binding LytR/AlgR family response regulator [Rhizobium leguminosarum]MBB4308237.1 DNA-binding LytR/AlgR family response regulator [Rhizobium leguminosarum]MBB4416073.1 DNA-binding LytR/AlgR family response regulator [Rhizobium leguminosarum]MBB4430960.1 DNA-binding LytR/AlgR family response regulator [Rhizobium esperanzae]